MIVSSTDDGQFEVCTFHAGHVHPLVTLSRRQFLRSFRNFSFIHMDFICKYGRVNFGASKVYYLMKEQVRGYEYMGCDQQDFKNYKRDLKVMIKDSDAHMFVDILKKRKEVYLSFYYAHEHDEENGLKNVFWCDSLCKRSYALFGDLLSFDTKHKTNRYGVVFAPFTGINHHRQLTCFGARLIRDEKVEPFKWLFQCFIDAMRGNKPKAIIVG